ncbi:Carbonic anhydrase 6 [Clonorchis sinensis]|uniref:carbonic anhydrase n=2 Tax=Clonorchis sinensis TaxID=79923 RepID=G7YBG2_CLOSI|nr:Carbonic anhydrase 6 [Clonorchis sinensis]GAA50296.1 carbonic anhydrase [Clonorchis sinensis]
MVLEARVGTGKGSNNVKLFLGIKPCECATVTSAGGNSTCILHSHCFSKFAENMLSIQLQCCILLGSLASVQPDIITQFSSEWSHTDTWSWNLSFPSCSGHYQSPVDLRSRNAVYNSQLGPIQFVAAPGFQPNNVFYDVLNNGHTVVILFDEDQWNAVITPDGDQYEIMQMHFHWGSTDGRGSEHLLEGRRFPMETHIVSYNKRLYSTRVDAIAGPNGLAVFGILHTLDDRAPDTETQFGIMIHIEEALRSATYAGQSWYIPGFSLTDLLSQVNTSTYFRYHGSLTTPPCTENVMWTVFMKPIPIKSTQLSLLRNLRSSSYNVAEMLYDNYRPTQLINGPQTPLRRCVFKSVPGSAVSKISDFSITLASILMVFVNNLL